MNYLLRKLAPFKFILSQGDVPGKNEIHIIFNSARSTNNFICSKTKKHTLLFHDSKKIIVLDDNLIKKLDKVNFIDTIRESYPEVKSIKFDHDKTTVKLMDDYIGTTVCHTDDVYNQKLGFLYAYDNARNKKSK